MYEDDDENKIYFIEESKEEGLTLFGLLTNGKTIITSYISTQIYVLISKSDNLRSSTIIITLTFLIWISIQRFIRHFLSDEWILKHYKIWRRVIIGLIEFISSLGLFLSFELIMGYVFSIIDLKEIYYREFFGGIFNVTVIIFSVAERIYSLQ